MTQAMAPTHQPTATTKITVPVIGLVHTGPSAASGAMQRDAEPDRRRHDIGHDREHEHGRQRGDARARTHEQSGDAKFERDPGDDRVEPVGIEAVCRAGGEQLQFDADGRGHNGDAQKDGQPRKRRVGRRVARPRPAPRA